MNAETRAKSSTDTFTSIDLYGDSVHEHGGDDGGRSRFHLDNESGTGDITMYHVFPGIELVYNDMHMAYCNKEQEPAHGVMEINYCREGRSECLFGAHKEAFTDGRLHDHQGKSNSRAYIFRALYNA